MNAPSAEALGFDIVETPTEEATVPETETETLGKFTILYEVNGYSVHNQVVTAEDETDALAQWQDIHYYDQATIEPIAVGQVGGRLYRVSSYTTWQPTAAGYTDRAWMQQ